ncbi:hypothetical protein BH11PLA1_BH11PLA1_12510 [soil metagenome]
MHLYILRHAEAEDRAASGSDADRALTARGRRQAAWIGAEIARRVPRATILLTSPIRRAKETARALHDAGLTAAREEAGLSTRADLHEVAGAIEAAAKAHAPDAALVLVGHNPTLEEFIAYAEPALGTSPQALQKSECVILTRAARDASARGAAASPRWRVVERICPAESV